ncbi:MAG: hypothetical protein OET44_12665 [Gammaproteobacteria bacterium]|nr:hypothetical protein [Gammaproteobacteria bacterium]
MSREMNLQIAMKFLDWRLRKPEELAEEGIPVPEALVSQGQPILVAERDNTIDFYTRDELPDFSSDISAAWEVVERMGDKLVSISRNLMGNWVIMVNTSMGPKQYSAEMAPEAICRAALAISAKS